jgi:hypothetical protein
MRIALVVGINNYQNNPLAYCVNDACGIKNVLEKNSDNSPNFDVKLITSPTQMIERASLRKNIELLFSKDCDIALFYFSGHGFIKSTGGYIITTDYKKYDEGISMDDILLLANNSKAKDKIVILDCCHSGAFGTPAITGSGSCFLSEGLTVLTACKDSESAIEANGYGLFTSLIISALQGGAADIQGSITPGSIYAYVDQALGYWEQRPIFKTNVSRFISLRKTTPPIAVEILRKICIYFPTPDYEYSMDPTYEFTSDKAIVSHVQIFKHLQKYESIGLVKPNGEEHMYFAAMNSKSCHLTLLGHHYWRLVKRRKI